MARLPLGFIGRVKGGPARGGLGRELRFYTDPTLAVAKTVYVASAGAPAQPVPIVPNAGIPRALAADRLAGDTFVTVAVGQTGDFNVGDLVPIWNGANTVYRVITAITPATGRLDLDSALGLAFTVAAGTMVNATDMEGYIYGWVEDNTDTWVQVTELGSNRKLAPVRVAAAAPALIVAVQEEGALAGSRGTINFIGPTVTAVDDGANNRVNVTVAAGPTGAQYVVGAADATLTAELVLGTAVIMEGTLGTRPAASLNGRLYVSTDETGGRIVYRDTSAAWNRIAFPAGTAVFDPAAHAARHNAGGADVMAIDAAAATGSLRTLGAGAAQAAAGNHAHTLTTASAQLGADQAIATAGTFVDAVSVSLAAGVWLIIAGTQGHVAPGVSNSAAGFVVKLWDGTTVFASGEGAAYQGTFAVPTEVNVALAAIRTLGGTTTVKTSATTAGGTGTIKAATTDSGSGNNATWILAVKIG